MQLTWHVGDVVRKLREARSLTQKDLARRAGCHSTTIERVEGGGKWRAEKLDAIARALGTTRLALETAVPPTTPVAEVEPRSAPTARTATEQLDPKALKAAQTWYEQLSAEDQERVRKGLPPEVTAEPRASGKAGARRRRRARA